MYFWKKKNTIDTGAAISSLDIPVSLTIKVDALGVTLQNATVDLDVVR